MFVTQERTVNIKFENIFNGCMTFILNNHSFKVNYLTDFKNEMEYLLDLPEDPKEVKRICIDGEEIDLYLTAWRVYNDLFIIWEEWTDICEMHIMQFNYDDFVESYNKELDYRKIVLKNYF